MISNTEKQIKRNKLFYYFSTSITLFGSSFIFITGIFLMLMDFSFWFGHCITYVSLIFTALAIILTINKPDFNPRTIKMLEIQNKVLKDIEKIICNCFTYIFYPLNILCPRDY